MLKKRKIRGWQGQEAEVRIREPRSIRTEYATRIHHPTDRGYGNNLANVS
jgi:hypothetical protein